MGLTTQEIAELEREKALFSFSQYEGEIIIDLGKPFRYLGLTFETALKFRRALDEEIKKMSIGVGHA